MFCFIFNFPFVLLTKFVVVVAVAVYSLRLSLHWTESIYRLCIFLFHRMPIRKFERDSLCHSINGLNSIIKFKVKQVDRMQNVLNVLYIKEIHWIAFDQRFFSNFSCSSSSSYSSINAPSINGYVRNYSFRRVKSRERAGKIWSFLCVQIQQLI